MFRRRAPALAPDAAENYRLASELRGRAADLRRRAEVAKKGARGDRALRARAETLENAAKYAQQQLKSLLRLVERGPLAQEELGALLRGQGEVLDNVARMVEQLR